MFYIKVMEVAEPIFCDTLHRLRKLDYNVLGLPAISELHIKRHSCSCHGMCCV
jgi:hypothetical protein